MPLTIEEAKAFKDDAKNDLIRQNWLTMAKYSWDEIKKRQKNNRLWSATPNLARRRGRYPAWANIFRIRQPLVLSRIGIPIGKDTTQDGNDNIGATAAILIERLAINLAKSFDFFDVMCACRDDALATNFTQSRAYYECKKVKEKVKEYLEATQDPRTGEAVFLDAAGKIVTVDEVYQDDEGYFLEHEQTIDIDDERICIEPILYTEAFPEPDIRRWSRCKRYIQELHYSPMEFKEIFGVEAYNDIPRPEPLDESAPKKQNIMVNEYWDAYEKECYWWAELGPDFIKPKSYMMPEGEDYDEDDQLNGLYNLEKFFPLAEPLIINAPTDEFWPVPEYYQVVEILEDIHTLFARMMAMTRAIRPRLLFDDSVEGLAAALKEGNDNDTFGVTNLTQALVSANGSLENVVQYIPIEKIVESLASMYQALEGQIMRLFKLTGTSDLLQGLTTDNSGKTLGERQIEEKYATNQIAELQRKMAEFVRANYQLMVEMAIKNFKDSSLDKYIMPQTLEPEHRERYKAALGMLKDDSKRFRIELETDSTIALNESYDKQMRIELVNTLTMALEKTANIAQTSPALVKVELHCLKFLIQGFRQGKLFQSEMTQAIDQVIEMASQAEPAFNKDQAMANLKQMELDATNKLEQYKILSDEKIEIARVNQEGARIQLENTRLMQEGRMAQIQAQLDTFKVQSEAGQSNTELRLKYQEISANIATAQQELMLKRDELMVELRKVTDKKEVDQVRQIVEAKMAGLEMQLSEAQQVLEQQKAGLDMREKYMTEQRLQSEHELDKRIAQVEVMAKIQEAQKPQPLPPITINMPETKSTKKKFKVKHDEYGNIAEVESSHNEG